VTDENYLFNQDGQPPEPIRSLEFIESFFAFTHNSSEDLDEEEVFSKKNVPMLNEDDICKSCESYIGSLEFFATLE